MQCPFAFTQSIQCRPLLQKTFVDDEPLPDDSGESDDDPDFSLELGLSSEQVAAGCVRVRVCRVRVWMWMGEPALRARHGRHRSHGTRSAPSLSQPTSRHTVVACRIVTSHYVALLRHRCCHARPAGLGGGGRGGRRGGAERVATVRGREGRRAWVSDTRFRCPFCNTRTAGRLTLFIWLEPCIRNDLVYRVCPTLVCCPLRHWAGDRCIG
jgi:hypothetical protein